jgi:hypothetical protein
LFRGDHFLVLRFVPGDHFLVPRFVPGDHFLVLSFVPGDQFLVLSFVPGDHFLVLTITRNFEKKPFLRVKMNFPDFFTMVSEVTRHTLLTY